MRHRHDLALLCASFVLSTEEQAQGGEQRGREDNDAGLRDGRGRVLLCWQSLARSPPSFFFPPPLLYLRYKARRFLTLL